MPAAVPTAGVNVGFNIVALSNVPAVLGVTVHKVDCCPETTAPLRATLFKVKLVLSQTETSFPAEVITAGSTTISFIVVLVLLTQTFGNTLKSCVST